MTGSKRHLSLLLGLVCACDGATLPGAPGEASLQPGADRFVDSTPKQPSSASVAARVSGARVDVISLDDELPRGAFETRALLGVPATSNSITLDGDVVVIDRGVATERLAPHGDFVAQSWQWAQAPTGGDLVVEVGVAGLLAAAPDGRPGLGFVEPTTGRGVRYGGARWIDADGVVTLLAPAVVDGGLRLTVPEVLLAASAFPALLDPEIGPELDVDGPVVGPSGYADEAPVVARGAGDALVVWTDSRNGRSTDLFGARVATDGTLLDAAPLPIATALGTQQEASVAALGAGWLVVWTDDRGGGDDIYGVTVSGAGVVGPPFVVAATGADERAPTVDADADRALVAWTASGDIAAAVVGPGRMVTPLGALSSGPTVDDHPDVAHVPGGDWLVAWDEDSVAIRGVRVSSAGAIVDAVSLPLSVGDGFRMYPSVAWSGSSYLLAFSLILRIYDIHVTRVTTAGVPLDLTGTAGGIPIAVAPPDQRQSWARVACGGGACAVTWHRGIPGEEDVLLQMTSDTGVPVGEMAAIGGAPRPQLLPDVSVSSLGEALAVWQDQRGGAGADAFAARVTAAGVVLDAGGIPVSMGFNRQQEPAIVSREGGFLVVWSDSGTGPGFRIHARHLDNDGRAIGGTSPIGGSSFGSATTPSITTPANGRALLAWSDTRAGLDGDVYASVVNTVGNTVVAEVPIAVGTGMQVVPTVAVGTDSYLVAWQDRRDGTFDIRASVLDRAGAAIAANFAVAVAPDDQVLPHAAFDPISGGYLVVWQDSRDGGDRDIIGARITEAGLVLDADGVVIAGAPGLQERPRVSTSGDGTLVAWTDQRVAGNRDVYAARLDLGAANPVLDADGILICGAAGKQTGVDVDAIPNGFVIAWQDFRDDPTERRGDLYAATLLLTTGQVAPLDGAVLAGNAANEQAVSLALSDRRGVFTYSRRHDDLEADRVEVRSYRR
ncbi:MAG: hypothetical protein HYS27_09210 [Deltaproteobacteria bacterium]|nr:hypothetical protein [Deltaproteobacteria bacterium]